MITPRRNVRADVALLVEPDGVFVVLAGEEVLVRTRVDTLATLVFDEAVEARDPSRATRARERAHYEMQAMRSESFARREASARKRGGRGGRGGV